MAVYISEGVMIGRHSILKTKLLVLSKFQPDVPVTNLPLLESSKQDKDKIAVFHWSSYCKADVCEFIGVTSHRCSLDDTGALSIPQLKRHVLIEHECKASHLFSILQ